jgi:hypothetical protein
VCRQRPSSAPRRTGFAVQVEGVDVRWFQLKRGTYVRAHPEFDQREAARYSGLSWTEFQRLDGREKAACIAFYRLSRRLEQVLAELETRKAV